MFKVLNEGMTLLKQTTKQTKKQGLKQDTKEVRTMCMKNIVIEIKKIQTVEYILFRA